MASVIERIRGALSSPTVESMAAPIAPIAKNSTPLHPYYPLEAEVVGYLANEWNTFELCALFAAGCSVIFTATYLVTKRLRPQVSMSDLITVMWFVLCTWPVFPLWMGAMTNIWAL
jgi:cholestenol delta-isomerase